MVRKNKEKPTEATPCRLVSPLRTHGGKHYLAPRIVALMPKHTHYLEAYSGGLSVLLAKPCEGVAEYVNDLNGELMNFWMVVSAPELFEKFERRMECVPLSEPLFTHTGEGIESGRYTGTVESAMAFFVRARMSRQGLGKDYCTPTRRTRRGMNENVSAWLSAIDGLPDIHARLRRVEVWNRPAVEAIRKLDQENLLTFCDPPYLHSTRSTKKEYGEYEMTEAQHVELLECLRDMKGKFMLSGYPSELYDSFDFNRVEFKIANSASSSAKKEVKTEVVWMNF